MRKKLKDFLTFPPNLIVSGIQTELDVHIKAGRTFSQGRDTEVKSRLRVRKSCGLSKFLHDQTLRP